MIKITKVISTAFDNLNRLIPKVLVSGKDDVQTGTEISPYGVDSNPIKDMYAVYAKTETKGKKVIIGYLNVNRLAETGETRLFSTDDSGALQTYIWLTKDGFIELGGDADHAVKFSKMKEVIEELQTDLANLKQAFNSWVVVPNDGGSALKASSATWAGTPLTKDIDDAKNDKIKTI